MLRLGIVGNRGRRGTLTAALSALVVLALVAVPARPASATVSCTFDGAHTDTVTSTSTSVTFSRDVDDLDVNGSACSTVNKVTRVNVDMGAVDNAFLTLDLGGGQFAPDVNPAAEINFQVSNFGSGLRASVEGTSGPDKFAVGDRFFAGSSVTGFDLNGFAESTPGEDVVLHGRAGEIGLSGEDGPDVLTGAGTGTPLSHPTTTNMVLNDGRGLDTVTGGNGNDIIGPQEGPDAGDVFSGGAGFDFIDYEGWHQGVTVSLDGKANDGANCPTNCDDDNVMPDIESVRGTSFNDVLTGGPGPDRIEGLSGTNVIRGGAGDDQLSGGSGQDTFHAGPGFDLVSYFSETDPITVTLDGVAHDGTANEHDNVEPDVEEVIGGFGSDRLVGDARANTLIGGPGDDVLNGARATTRWTAAGPSPGRTARTCSSAGRGSTRSSRIPRRETSICPSTAWRTTACRATPRRGSTTSAPTSRT